MHRVGPHKCNWALVVSSIIDLPYVSLLVGVRSYVPGLGTDGKGILVSIGGGTATQYVDDGSVLDIYDIGAGGWTKQSTLGDRIGTRVNHCSVRASAKVHGVETHHM